MDKAKMDIEDFIRGNREAFDAYEPDPLLWQQIQKQLDPPAAAPAPGRRIIQMMPPRHIMWRAAAAVVVLVSAFFAIRTLLPKDSTDAGMASNTAQVNLTEVSPQLAEADAFYTQQIMQKRQEIKTLAVSLKDPAAQHMCTKDFDHDIQQLDSMYTVLKLDLAAQPANEKVADAMIENLQLRIEILNQQLGILKKFKDDKNQHHENNNRAL